ncbi:MAG: universal stress protein [Pseudomonadota bacterium]
MRHATVLFCIDTETPDDTVKTAARDATAQDMRLVLLVYEEFPTLPISAYGPLPYGGISVPDAWSETLAARQEKLKARCADLDALLGDEDVTAQVIPVIATHLDLRRSVEQVAQTCDLAFFAPNLRAREAVYREMLHAVLFASPVPVVVNGSMALPHDTVLLAWNDSLAGARAAHVALPYLTGASAVHVVTFDAATLEMGQRVDPGLDAAAWLSHHGCEVTLTQLPTGGREVGACILDHAAEIGADLIVAGGYGHSRFRQAVFGGTSRTLIDQETVPVLLAH